MKKLLLGAAMAGLFTVGAFAQQQGAWEKAKSSSSGQSQSQSQGSQKDNPTWNDRKEAAQEKASKISDDVDIVNGPEVRNVTAHSATLVWTTNNNAATRVRYGTNRVSPGMHAYMPGGSREHSVQLTSLKPNTKYYYEIENRGGKDRFKGSFTTPGR